jgi:serralysin
MSPDWHIPFTGDFNGDGKSDILWQNNNGALGVWQLNGNSVIATQGLGTVSADWHLAETGDFNGDGNSDLLWRNDNGATSIWDLYSGGVLATLPVGTLSADWHVARTGLQRRRDERHCSQSSGLLLSETVR